MSEHEMLKKLQNINLQLFAEPKEPQNTEPVEPTEPTEPKEPTEPAKQEPKEDKTSEVLKSLMDKISSLEDKLKEPPKTEPVKTEPPAEPTDKDKDKDKAVDNSLEEQLEALKTESAKKATQVTEYEGILSSLIEAKLSDVPEELKGLVPENLSIKDKLDWIIKAEKTGIFGGTKGNIEIGKPLNPKDTKISADDSKLSASARMALAYESSKKSKK